MGEPDPDAVDYYSRIGVDPDADHDTVERQRKQADRRFSPMSSSPQGDEKRHMQINAASNVLETPEERARYDHCYDAFGPNRGTAVYETLSESVLDEVLDEPMLAAHLRGFVDVLGAVTGARAFEEYYHELSPESPEGDRNDELPNGYSVEDAGFGVAAWSFHEAGEPCDRARWLTGGRDLWRAALQGTDDVDALLEDRNTQPETATTAPTPEPEERTPTTRISGHPSSGTPSDDLPSEYTPGTTEPSDDSGSSPTRDSRGWRPFERLGESLSYLGVTGAWGLGSVGALTASALAAVVVAAVAFVPLLALALFGTSTLPSLDGAVQSAVGVPLSNTDDPFATTTLVHYGTLAVAGAVSLWLTARVAVPKLHARKDRHLPRDAWFVFVLTLLGLAGALFVSIRQNALPRPVAVGVTALVTAGTFQAALDVGAPPLLSRLCRGVSATVFGLASTVVAMAVLDVALRALDPALATAFTAPLADLPLVATPLVGIENAEVVVVAFGALAFVPLALTTLYSLTYAVESVLIRLRSRAAT